MVVHPREKQITALPPSPKHRLLLELDALDKVALMQEPTLTIEQAVEVLGIGKQKITELCKTQKDDELPIPHAMIAGEYRFYRTLLLWWLLNQQKVGR